MEVRPLKDNVPPDTRSAPAALEIALSAVTALVPTTIELRVQRADLRRSRQHGERLRRGMVHTRQHPTRTHGDITIAGFHQRMPEI